MTYDISRRTILGAAVAPALIRPSFAQTAEPIRLGAILSSTGPGAGVGLPQRNGVQLAVKTINAAGGINGKPIQLLLEDDASNPDIAVTKANNLIFTQKVKAIIGPTLTASTLAVGGVAEPAKIPVMAFTGLGLEMETQRRSIFHMLPPQDLNARALLEFVTKELKTKKVGVLHDSAYGNLVMTKLREVNALYGVNFVATEKWEVGATDVTTQAAKIKAAAPDVVFIIGNSATPFRNARQIRLNVPLMSALGTASYEYVRAMGDAADNIIFAEFLVAEDPLPYQAAFVETFRREYNTLPKTMEASAWDAVHAVAAAIEKLGPAVEPSLIAETLREPYDGVMAKFDFSALDLTGLKLGSYVFSKLEQGKFTRLPFVAGK